MRFHSIIKFTLAGLLLVAAAAPFDGMAQGSVTRKTTTPKKNGNSSPGKNTGTKKNGSGTSGKKSSAPAAPGSSNSLGVVKGQWQKTALYTFSQGERINDKEYLSGKKFHDNNWMMLTRSPQGAKLIKNGRVIQEAPNWIAVEAYDPDTNNALYYWRNSNNEWYIHVDGADLGPFSEINYFKTGLDDPMKAEFYYKKMGMNFFRDFTGISTKLDSPYERGDSRVTYKSPNGRHTMQFSPDKKSITVDGTRYTIFPADRKDVYIFRADVNNNGSWYVGGRSTDSKNVTEWIEKGCVNGVVKDLGQSTGLGLSAKRGFYKLSEGNDPQPGAKSYTPFADRDFDYKWIEERKEAERCTEFMLQGRTPSDEFLSSWEYDYVLINNKKVGNAAAIDAWYDPQANAFVWISIDGNKLYKNSYGL